MSYRLLVLTVLFLLVLGGGASLGIFLYFRADRHQAPAVPPSPPPVLLGQVRDADGPVAGAEVRYQGDQQAVTTDKDGQFQLPLHPGRAARVTAWKNGYFITGAAADASPLVLQLRKLPLEDWEKYAWVDPAANPAGEHNCANCHQTIYDEWSASGHARSATNPRLLNLFDGSDSQGRPNVGWNLVADEPDGIGVCHHCHAPTAAPFSDLRTVKGVAATGVHCDFCHKIKEAGLGTIGLTHGRYNFDLLRPASGQVFFGPFKDVERGNDTFSPLYQQSLYCASCHEGIVFGVHVYSTYSEWLASPARAEGKQCQTCHMTPTGTMTNMAPGKGGVERNPMTLANHSFFAGSRQEMLRRSLEVNAGISRTGTAVDVEVRLRAVDVGHRVPTGFIDRHLILVVEGLRAGETKPIPAVQGPTLPGVTGKEYEGLPGRLYAKLLQDFDGRAPVPFWKTDGKVVDTRLVPGQEDRSRFSFPAEIDRIRVRVLHRRFWSDVVRSKGWPDDTFRVVTKEWPVPKP